MEGPDAEDGGERERAAGVHRSRSAGGAAGSEREPRQHPEVAGGTQANRRSFESFPNYDDVLILK